MRVGAKKRKSKKTTTLREPYGIYPREPESECKLIVVVCLCVAFSFELHRKTNSCFTQTTRRWWLLPWKCCSQGNATWKKCHLIKEQNEALWKMRHVAGIWLGYLYVCQMREMAPSRPTRATNLTFVKEKLILNTKLVIFCSLSIKKPVCQKACGNPKIYSHPFCQFWIF